MTFSEKMWLKILSKVTKTMVLLSLLENIILEHNFETTGGQIASHLTPYAPTSLTSLFSVEKTVEPSTLTHQA